MEKVVLISLYSKKSGTIVYLISIFSFLANIFYIIDSLLIAGIFTLAMIVFTVQLIASKFIRLEDHQIIIQGLANKDVIKHISEFEEIYAAMGFGSTLIMKFKDGSRYFFWGKNSSTLTKLIKQQLT